MKAKDIAAQLSAGARQALMTVTNHFENVTRSGATDAQIDELEQKLLVSVRNLEHEPAWYRTWALSAEGLDVKQYLQSRYQTRVGGWLRFCFGAAIAGDKVERNHRFLEEALELVQTSGCSASEAHQLVDYVFNRPTGQRSQEVGGVMVTLAAYCEANDIDMEEAGEVELARVYQKAEAIRAKQAAKPAVGPLPQ